jgi:integrase/recombinase XerD
MQRNTIVNEVVFIMALRRKARRTGGPTVERTLPKLTLDQAIDFVISGKKAEGLRERTVRDYAKNWEYMTEWLHKNYEGIEFITDVTTDMIRSYVNYLRYDRQKYEGHTLIDSEQQGRGLKETSINIRLRVFKVVFNYLESEGYINDNPTDNVKLLRQDIDLTNAFTEDEIKALLKQPYQRDYVGFRDFVAMNVLLDSGLRANELLNLRIADVDFQTRFITLSGGQNKNRKPRLVPVSSHVTKLLLQLINENKESFPKTDRIFLSVYGEPLAPNHFNKRLKYYAELAGIIAEKTTAHVYRHTWAKNMILNGCDPFTLQKMGGWSDIRTMRRYIQMDTEELRRSHDDFSPINKMRNKR